MGNNIGTLDMLANEQILAARPKNPFHPLYPHNPKFPLSGSEADRPLKIGRRSRTPHNLYCFQNFLDSKRLRPLSVSL